MSIVSYCCFIILIFKGLSIIAWIQCCCCYCSENLLTSHWCDRVSLSLLQSARTFCQTVHYSVLLCRSHTRRRSTYINGKYCGLLSVTRPCACWLFAAMILMQKLANSIIWNDYVRSVLIDDLPISTIFLPVYGLLIYRFFLHVMCNLLLLSWIMRGSAGSFTESLHLYLMYLGTCMIVRFLKNYGVWLISKAL